MSGLAAVALVLGLSTSALAQQAGGSIRGHVEGANAGTQVEVVDTERGTTKAKSTSSGGAFRFDNLSVGDYDVRVIQDGVVVDSTEVKVSLASATTLNMATTAEAIEEIITTGTRMAAMDTSIAESGLVISSEELLELPVQRDMKSVALIAPGVSRGDYRFGNDPGENGAVSFAGASVAENTNFINGLNTTNFRTGIGFSEVPFEFYETIQIKTGGYSAKYGRSLGGVMNAKTKSGSNDWSFGANVYYDTLLNESPRTFAAANEQDQEDKTTFDVYVSGPIIKDRLFFYALYSDVQEDDVYAGVISQRGYQYELDQGFYGAKLDAYITDDHHLEYTFFRDERTGVEDTFGFDPATGQFGSYIGPTNFEQGGDNWIATYTGDLTDSLQVSVSYGENEANRTTAPATASEPVVYTYLDGFVPLGNWTEFLVDTGGDKREMLRADVSWIVGNHSIEVGIDNEENFADAFTIPSGGVYWLLDSTNDYNGCSPSECPSGANVRRRTYEVGGSFETSSKAWYIQDTWDVNENWTLELGIRNEVFENLNSEGDIYAKVEDQWAPRFSVVWDPKGDGSSKWFANYGLYYLPIAANTNIRLAGGETYIHDYFDWDGVSVDSQFVPQGLPASPYETRVFGTGETLDPRSQTDTNMDAMYQSEIILGYARTLDNGSEIGIKGVYRNLEKTIEDVAIDFAVIEHYDTVGWDTSVNAGDAFDPDDPFNTGCGAPDSESPNTRDCGASDYFDGFHQYVLTNPGNAMNIFIPEQNEYVSFSASQLRYPEAERQYAAVEFTYDRPFDGRWGFNGSYTWAHSWGNHEGYVKSDNAQDDAGITTNFDQPEFVENSYGNLPNDRRHTIKTYGTYVMDSGLRFGVGAQWQSGRPISCFGLHPVGGLYADYYGAAAHFCQGEAVKRGTLGTTPDILNVDVTMQYAVDIGNYNVMFALDIFNLFDSQNATQVWEVADLDSGAPDPDFLKTLQFQPPRALRLSARMKF